MVDREARDRAADVFRALITGKISNDAFEDSWPRTSDRAIDAIFDTAWLLYSDDRQHKLVGTDRLPTDTRRTCIRWLLFLHGDLDYEWPDLSLPGLDPAVRVERRWWKRILAVTSRDALRPEVAKSFLAAGHYPVWPFIRVTDYRNALRHPRFLSGGRRARGTI